MWNPKPPESVKLIIGILATDKTCLNAARKTISARLGAIDLQSETWSFTHTDYYAEQTGPDILRRFVSIEKLIDPGRLAKLKHKTNRLEQHLADRLNRDVPRPVNLDPGIIEPAKLVLASTKNYSHRIYIGNKIYAEVTLIYGKGAWKPFEYTYPDYRQQCYFDFFTEVRTKLLEQLKH